MALLLPVAAAHAQVQGTNVVSVTSTFSIQPIYDFYASGSGLVATLINASSLQITSSTPFEAISSYRPAYAVATAVVNGSSEVLPVVVNSGRYGSFFSYDLVLPANATSFVLDIEGSVGGNAALWRYVAGIPTVSINGWGGPVFYTLDMQIPSGSSVSGAYDNFGNSFPTSYLRQVATYSPGVTYNVPPNVSTVILEPGLFVPVALGFTIAASAAIVLVAMGLFRMGRVILTKVIIGIKGGVVRVLNRARLPTKAHFPFSVRKLARPKTILVLFLLCAILMISLGVAAGPDPQVKAYVIADPSGVNAIRASLAGAVGSVAVVTPDQDYVDFATMSSVGDFNVVVVSNYPTLALPPVSEFVLPSLGNVPLVIVDNSSDPMFASQINLLYPSQVVHVQNAANLTGAESQEIASDLSSELRTNLLGLHLGETSFKVTLTTEAGLSFVLIFLGWAYLGSLISDSGSQSELAHLGTVIAAGVFVFVFSEIIYVEVSSLLAFPLSLHAVISGAKDITAVGLLGFGGGSTPRLASGFIGLLAGITLAEGRPPLHKEDFALIIAIPILLLANPFFIGNFAFEAVLLFVGNFSIGTAFATSLSLKGFIYGFGEALGGGVTGTYLLSAGKMLYFAGLAPLAYLKRMGRTSMALTILLCAVIVGDGGVRVGEMTPTKTYIAVLPGLAVGFAFLAVFLGLALAEKYIRGLRQ
jgi:hypothetical protein